MNTTTPLVIVTGACGGIGAAVTQHLLTEGYAVLACDTQEQILSNTQHPTEKCEYYPLDVTDETCVQHLGDYLRQRHQPVQGLINCAGIVHAAPLLETTLEQWRTVHAVNADGVFLVTREVAQYMIEQQPQDPTNSRGIVTISSNAANVPRAEFGAYGASKAAATRVTTSFGLQLAPHGIRANVLCPGTTRTPMVTDSWNGEDLSQTPIKGSLENYRLGIPLGRIAEPEDIAEVATFLLSPRAKHVTMQSLTVDGGATF
ncbi:SDR family oxidoreductase [Rothia sp. P13129]|uniref:SDR family oxidoreductase n=1 Tax=unclassified Rothia (in: high G+C Gram-positive bacteria) TaxID=2689056 RepID=UPI003AD50281